MTDLPSVRLEELRWPDVETYLDEAANPTVVVPIGSTEQHGPHLPLGVDRYEAEDVAVAVAERTGTLVAPTIPYGDADHHLAFPGTISLSTETVVSVLVDIYESLAGHGFANVVTVNGHRIANLPAIETAMKAVAAEAEETAFAAVDLLKVAAETHRTLRDGDPEDGMHGGEFETSFMLHHHPDLVRPDAFERETHERDRPFETNDLVASGDVVITPNTGHSPDEGDLGHVGDPTLASAEKGEKLSEAIVSNAAAYVEAVRDEPTD